MSMADELAQLASEHRRELEAFRGEVRGSFQKIREDHAKATEANEERREEQEREIYEKSDLAKHDKLLTDSELKIGFRPEEEPETSTPVRREAQGDDSTRSFAVGGDEDEESEPYRRPQRWNDDDEEPPANGHTPREDWGGSTRRIGNYGDDD